MRTVNTVTFGRYHISLKGKVGHRVINSFCNCASITIPGVSKPSLFNDLCLQYSDSITDFESDTERNSLSSIQRNQKRRLPNKTVFLMYSKPTSDLFFYQIGIDLGKGFCVSEVTPGMKPRAKTSHPSIKS